MGLLIMARGRPKKIVDDVTNAEPVVEQPEPVIASESVESVPPVAEKPDNVIVVHLDGYTCFESREKAKELKAIGQVVSINEIER